jgi:hypothetical protein
MENLFDAAKRAEEKNYLIVDDYDSINNRLLLDVDNFFRSWPQSSLPEAMLRSFGNVLKTAVIDRILLFIGLTLMAFSDWQSSSLNMVMDLIFQTPQSMRCCLASRRM